MLQKKVNIEHVESLRQRIETVEWKGHRQRKEVGPRERQDETTSVEGQEQRKQLSKGQASERSALPKEWERAKAKTRKVSQVDNPTKMGKSVR